MYQKILLPLDGSELAEAVFTYAKELAGRLDLEVILLCVGSSDLHEFTPMYEAYIERAAEIIQRQAREVQRKTGLRPGGKLVKTRGETAEGYPAEEILRYADENHVDMILMATHGRSGRKRWVMGNVADKVLRASKVPVWLVRTGTPEEIAYDQWPKRTILVPLDGSELAEAVLPHAEALAKQRGTEPVEVTLLRICEPPAAPFYYAPDFTGVPLNWGEYLDQEVAKGREVAKEYLGIIEKRFKDIGISVQSEVLVGKAADEIVEYTNNHPFTLIVMATHGRSGLSRWVYGSVAENVLTGAYSPILLIRTSQPNTK